MDHGVVKCALRAGSLAIAMSAFPAEAQNDPAVREIAPGVTEVDGGRVRVDAVDLASLESTIANTSSLRAVQRLIGRAEVVSPAGGDVNVHMYRVTDTATNAPKLVLVFVQGRDRIIDHSISDREP